MNGNGRQGQGQQNGNGHAARMAEIAMRGTALLWDLQAETARNLLALQAGSATLFGAPDMSGMFHVGEARTKGVFSTTVDQAINSLRQISDTMSEVQQSLAQVAEQEAAGITERMQKGFEELGRRSEEGLEEIRRLAAEEADEMEARGKAQHGAADEEEAGGNGRRRGSPRTGRRRKGQHRAAA
jgi:ElaB/YqjD/DUF883 family membrane-anchored ribosome-binding protein